MTIFFLKVCASLGILVAIAAAVGAMKDRYDRYGWPIKFSASDDLGERCSKCGGKTEHHCGMGACVDWCPRCDRLGAPKLTAFSTAQSWFCAQCKVEVYERRCPHCGKTEREKS